MSDGLDADIIGARGVGRAGAVSVSEDGGAALVLNPGGMVRRQAWRVQLGMRMQDDDQVFRALDAGAASSPRIENRAPPTSSPYVAIQGPIGPLVVGIAYLRLGAVAHALPRPQPNQTPEDVLRLFPHRYGGTHVVYERSALMLGAAVRARPWLGLGVAVSLASVALEEERHIWAGFAGRDVLGQPDRDLALTLFGRDRFVPGASVGALIAPQELPVEISLSLGYAMDAELGGDARLEPTRQAEYPAPALGDPVSHATLPSPLMVRAGARYLGDRVLVEAGYDMALLGDRVPVWTLQGVAVRDESQAMGELVSVPLLAAERGHATMRMAADIEVARGFLWLSAGYAYRMTGSSPTLLTPAFADLDSHMVALGAEGQWNSITLTIGYARTWSPALRVEESRITLINPFDAGTAPTGQGTYQSSRDVVGVSLEIAWE